MSKTINDIAYEVEQAADLPGGGELVGWNIASGKTFKVQISNVKKLLGLDQISQPNTNTVQVENDLKVLKELTVKNSSPLQAVFDGLGLGATAGIRILTDSDQLGFVQFGDEDDVNIGFINYNHANEELEFGVGNAIRMKVGQKEATFGSTTSGNWSVVISDQTLNDGQSRYFRARGIKGGLVRNAEIGVHAHAGISYPGAYLRLQRMDAVNAYYWTGPDGPLRKSNNMNDIGTTSGTVVGTQTSDIRVKNVDKKFKKYGLKEAVLLGKHQIRFSYIYDAENRLHIGLPAQEVKKVIPEAVYNTGEETEGIKDILAMYSTELIPVALTAIAELNDKINQLELKIAQK